MNTDTATDPITAQTDDVGDSTLYTDYGSTVLVCRLGNRVFMSVSLSSYNEGNVFLTPVEARMLAAALNVNADRAERYVAP